MYYLSFLFYMSAVVRITVRIVVFVRIVGDYLIGLVGLHNYAEYIEAAGLVYSSLL